LEIQIELESPEEALAIFGSHDRHLRLLKERFDVKVVARNGIVKLSGDDGSVSGASLAIRQLLDRVRLKKPVTPATVERAISGALGVTDVGGAGAGGGGGGGEQPGAGPPSGPLSIDGFRARSPGQQRYLDAIRECELVFAIGPAGTGKTFLAVLKAVEALKRGDVQKLVLSRPAVEAGEKLGFLPGDLQAKINPYLRPLYDALHEILDHDTVRKYMEREVIEIVPLAYMRGRTLNRAFIILDEAQNTTREQMKMFLTRMGRGSRIVVTGDVTQVDLPLGKASGLIHTQRVLAGVEGIAFVNLAKRDIVRHPLVWRIVHAYEREEKRPGAAAGDDDARGRPKLGRGRPAGAARGQAAGVAGEATAPASTGEEGEGPAGTGRPSAAAEGEGHTPS
jgi:phosphate starvation-inducible PhoH-like protein